MPVAARAPEWRHGDGGGVSHGRTPRRRLLPCAAVKRTSATLLIGLLHLPERAPALHSSRHRHDHTIMFRTGRRLHVAAHRCVMSLKDWTVLAYLVADHSTASAQDPHLLIDEVAQAEVDHLMAAADLDRINLAVQVD